jgi:predicted DNA-binding transcriptional regulator AlpA
MSNVYRLLRLPDIIGNRRENITAIFPVSRSKWYAGVASGQFPSPVKIGRCSCWREADILALVQSFSIEETLTSRSSST